jgi:hypothetical protein
LICPSHEMMPLPNRINVTRADVTTRQEHNSRAQNNTHHVSRLALSILFSNEALHLPIFTIYSQSKETYRYQIITGTPLSNLLEQSIWRKEKFTTVSSVLFPVEAIRPMCCFTCRLFCESLLKAIGDDNRNTRACVSMDL